MILRIRSVKWSTWSLRCFVATLFVLAAVPTSRAQTAYDEGLALYQRGQYERAVPVLRRGAQQGDGRNAYVLGKMANDGLGTRKDTALAMFWMLLGEAQGHKQSKGAANQMRAAFAPDTRTTARKHLMGWVRYNPGSVPPEFRARFEVAPRKSHALRELVELRDSELITDQEYKRHRARILGTGVTASSPPPPVAPRGSGQGPLGGQIMGSGAASGGVRANPTMSPEQSEAVAELDLLLNEGLITATEHAEHKRRVLSGQ